MDKFNPSHYLSYKKGETSFKEYILDELETIIRSRLEEMKSAPAKSFDMLSESFVKLMKTYLLLTGEATERKENISNTNTNITVLVEQIKQELGEEALKELDMKALEEVIDIEPIEE